MVHVHWRTTTSLYYSTCPVTEALWGVVSPLRSFQGATMTWTDPQDNVLYNEKKKQYDNFSHTTTMKGIYKVCFSNEFSTYTHKTVYLEFRHGEEQPLLEGMSRVPALTQVCEGTGGSASS